MRHQREIVAAVTPELGHVVGEAEAWQFEILGVAGQTGIDRIAARVDDARLGQDEADEADIDEVCRQFVDPAALAGGSAPTRAT